MALPRSIEDREDDHELVERFLCTRSQDDFRALYRRHTPALCGFAYRLAHRGRPDVDDIVQETWVRAVSRLEGFRGESSLRTWLRAICFNVFREWKRRHGSHEQQLEENGSQLRIAAAAATSGFTTADLERALADLAPGYREVLVLHDIEGYTHDEIARLSRIDVGTSKSQLSRARRAIRNRLNREKAQGCG